MNSNIEALRDIFQQLAVKPDTLFLLYSLASALAFSVILWGTYRLANTKESYQPRFGVTLVVLAFVSTVMMDLIRTNLALSLGMLGSLSIVRFRTNIQDPRDIGFIFWSMAIGIAAATGSYGLGLAGCLVLATVLLLTRRRTAQTRALMLVVRGSDTSLERIQEVVTAAPGSCQVKAKNILSNSYELVYEVSLPEQESDGVIRALFALGGVDSVNLLTPSSRAA